MSKHISLVGFVVKIKGKRESEEGTRTLNGHKNVFF